MERPAESQVEHALNTTSGWVYIGSDKVMPALSWEKYEVLAAHVRWLRIENDRLQDLLDSMVHVQVGY